MAPSTEWKVEYRPQNGSAYDVVNDKKWYSGSNKVASVGVEPINTLLRKSSLFLPEFWREADPSVRYHHMGIIDIDGIRSDPKGAKPMWTPDREELDRRIAGGGLDGADLGALCEENSSLWAARKAADLISARLTERGKQALLPYYTGKKGFRVLFRDVDPATGVDRAYVRVRKNEKWGTHENVKTYFEDLLGSDLLSMELERGGIKTTVGFLIDYGVHATGKGCKPDVQHHAVTKVWPTRGPTLSTNRTRDPDPALRREIFRHFDAICTTKNLSAASTARLYELRGETTEPTDSDRNPKETCGEGPDIDVETKRQLGGKHIVHAWRCILLDSKYPPAGFRVGTTASDAIRATHREWFFKYTQNFALHNNPFGWMPGSKLNSEEKRQLNEWILKRQLEALRLGLEFCTHEFTDPEDCNRLKLDFDKLLIDDHATLRSLQSILVEELGIPREHCRVISLGNPKRRSTHVAFPDIKLPVEMFPSIVQRIASAKGMPWSGSLAGKLDTQPLSSPSIPLRMLGSVKRIAIVYEDSNGTSANWLRIVEDSRMRLLAAVDAFGQPDEKRYATSDGTFEALTQRLLYDACVRALPGWTATPLSEETRELIRCCKQRARGKSNKVPASDAECVVLKELFEKYLLLDEVADAVFEQCGETDPVEVFKSPVFKSSGDGWYTASNDKLWAVCIPTAGRMVKGKPAHPADKAHIGTVYFTLCPEQRCVIAGCLRETCCAFYMRVGDTDSKFPRTRVGTFGTQTAPDAPPAKRAKTR